MGSDHPSANMRMVGITGTNGKTSSTHILEGIWRSENRASGLIGTVANRYGEVNLAAEMTTPHAEDLNKLLRDMREDGVDHVALEVSSHGLELGRVDDCHFDVAVFTNLTHDHLDFHESMGSYFAAKKRLFTDLLPKSCKPSTASIVNMDDPCGKRLLDAIATGALSFSTREKKADFFADNIVSLGGSSAKFDLQTPYGQLHIRSPLIGLHNVYNCMAAIAAALYLGSKGEAIEGFIENMGPIPGRLERIENTLGEVFVDYANTPDALTNGVESLRSITSGRVILVMGCGGNRDKEKRPIMGAIGAGLCDLLVVTSDNPRTEDPQVIIDDILSGVPAANLHKVLNLVDRREAIAHAVGEMGAGDVVLIAGRGHESHQLVGEQRIDFDDRSVAREVIREIAKKRVVLRPPSLSKTS